MDNRWQIEKVGESYHIRRKDFVGNSGFKTISVIPVRMVVETSTFIDNPDAKWPQLALRVKTKYGDLLYV